MFNVSINLSPNSAFFRLNIVYVAWLLGWMLASSLFEVYFFGLGMSPQEIFLANAFWFVAALMAIPLFRGFRAKEFMLMGILIAIISVALLYLFPFAWAAYVYRLVLGMTHLFFWVPFNVLFYEFRKENHAAMGALYYSLGPILSLFAPAFGGYLAAAFGFPVLFLAAIAVFALTFALTSLLIENREYAYDFVKSMRSVAGLRSLFFMEGFGAAVITSLTLEVMLLLFIGTPMEYGGFISFVTVFSVAATAITARLSDKLKKRRHFLLPIVACFGLAAIFTSFAPDVAWFFAGFGLINFFSRIFFPLPLALAVDNSKDLVETMVGREWVLNLGRLIGAILSFGAFILTDIRTVLLLQGLALLLYIPIFEHKKRKLQRH